MIEIHLSWYVENIELFLSQKSQFYLVEKIKDKNKKGTRASLFQSSEDGKQNICFMWPYWKNDCFIIYGHRFTVLVYAFRYQKYQKESDVDIRLEYEVFPS